MKNIYKILCLIAFISTACFLVFAAVDIMQHLEPELYAHERSLWRPGINWKMADGMIILNSIVAIVLLTHVIHDKE